MSNFNEIFRDLRKNKGALIGLLIIFFFIILAFFGPIMAPYSESELSPHLLSDPFWGQK